MFLSRDTLLGAKLKQEVVTVPELGGDVIVREATAAERSEYENSLMTTVLIEQDDGSFKSTPKENYVNHKARLVVKCVIDEQGQRMFKDEDIETLGKLPGGLISRFFTKIQELSGMTRKAARDVDAK